MGKLRDVEYELLVDNSKYAVSETCLALTIFRHELSPPVLGLFGVLLFVKAFHWLARSRLEYFEQVEMVSLIKHARLCGLMSLLVVVDILLTYYCVNYTLTHGKSVLILFGFEFGVLIITSLNTLFRYVLVVLEMRFGHRAPSKDLCSMIGDLLADIFRLIIYAYFFGLVFVYYGLPIHIIREFWMSYIQFRSRLTNFVRYVQLTHNLDQRFPNATKEEMAEACDCIICKEPFLDDAGDPIVTMSTCKRIPCGHIFHLHCLRGWLKQQQSCPLCRADIPVRDDSVTAAALVNLREANARNADDAAAAAAAGDAVGDAAAAGRNAAAAAAAAGAGAGAAAGVGAGDDVVHVAAPPPLPQPGGAIPNAPAITAGSSSSSSSSGSSTGGEYIGGFYIVTASAGVMVLSEPSAEASIVRYLPKGTLVFTKSQCGRGGGGGGVGIGARAGKQWWLELEDGWVLERATGAGTGAGAGTGTAPGRASEAVSESWLERMDGSELDGAGQEGGLTLPAGATVGVTESAIAARLRAMLPCEVTARQTQTPAAAAAAAATAAAPVWAQPTRPSARNPHVLASPSLSRVKVGAGTRDLNYRKAVEARLDRLALATENIMEEVAMLRLMMWEEGADNGRAGDEVDEGVGSPSAPAPAPASPARVEQPTMPPPPIASPMTFRNFSPESTSAGPGQSHFGGGGGSGRDFHGEGSGGCGSDSDGDGNVWEDTGDSMSVDVGTNISAAGASGVNTGNTLGSFPGPETPSHLHKHADTDEDKEEGGNGSVAVAETKPSVSTPPRASSTVLSPGLSPVELSSPSPSPSPSSPSPAPTSTPTLVPESPEDQRRRLVRESRARFLAAYEEEAEEQQPLLPSPIE